ncbi:MAG: hypothetical protein K2L41_02155, partial [Muribaculaceae bacterium]|nr:hypothetical protein [Muribaculaceae bacterium]
MDRFYKILRAVIVTVIGVAVTLPAVLYVGLSLPSVQRKVAGVACRELSVALGGDVEIGSLTIAPFNRAMMRDVKVMVNDGRDTVMTVERLGAGINLYELMVNRAVVVNYVEVVGLDMHVSRDSMNAPLNIQPIIDRLSPRDKKEPPRAVTLAINTVVLRNSSLSYDVDSEPLSPSGAFSPYHVAVMDLSADMRLPAVGGDRQVFEIKRFRVRASSGLEVRNLVGNVALPP